jgi:hypothetical protein
MAKKNTMSWKNIAVVVVVGAMLVSLLGFDIFSNIKGTVKEDTSSRSTREIALSCTTDEATTFHIHPHLHIFINGTEQMVPGNTGLAPECMHPIHTHMEDIDHSTIHVESPEARDFTLGDFFAVWGKVFNQNQILDAKIDATHEIVMTVNGNPSTAHENLVLKDGDDIVIKYQRKQAAGSIQLETSGGGTVKVVQ